MPEKADIGPILPLPRSADGGPIVPWPLTADGGTVVWPKALTQGDAKPFSGTSDNADLNEAIANACAAAKNGLPSSAVVWTLGNVVGVSGGIVQTNVIRVTILAAPGASLDP